MARAAEEAGADAVSLVNTFISLAIDAHTRRRRNILRAFRTDLLNNLSTTADELTMQDRRNDSRLFCADLIEVTWSDGGSVRHNVANLEDISPTGVCLMLESALPMGVEVAVRVGAAELKGVTRHATSGEAGFLIGIEFYPDSHWSSDLYQPQHMLDPQDMFPAGLEAECSEVER